MLGFVNLNKSAGMTSHDCVAKVRRLLKLRRVGHGGTLDPAATGVLPIAVGRATRLLQFLPENKAYEALIRLGVRTTTDDLEGEVIATQSAKELTVEKVSSLLSKFEGIIQQVPPAYSAIKQGGKKLYELARAGEEVRVPSRKVRVSKIEVLAWDGGEYPEIRVAIACGPGTYIRAIARDLGAELGVGGTLAALTRTESCGMKLNNSLTLEQIDSDWQQNQFSLLAPDLALQHLTAVSLTNEDSFRWGNGQRIETVTREQLPSKDTKVRVYREDGQFLGIGAIDDSADNWLLIPKVVLFV